jgi:hypothetical protein
VFRHYAAATDATSRPVVLTRAHVVRENTGFMVVIDSLRQRRFSFNYINSDVNGVSLGDPALRGGAYPFFRILL